MIKSVSDNNLANIVKEMINIALKDSDQIAKLHQAIYEEWYFKKMMELKDTRNRMENEVSSSPSCNLKRNISNGANTSNEIKYLPKQDLDNIRIECNKKLTKKMRRKLSFESWKKEKNLIYKRLLKEMEEEKQRELQKKLKDIECKKASQQIYAQIIKEKEAQERRELKQLQMIQQMNIEILQKQNDKRRIINDQAFNIWKRQKDIKLKETKLMTITQFDSWLDQLNSISCRRYF
ncbi:hypothetical protein ACFW04_004213 [Cataglyphis niger]